MDSILKTHALNNVWCEPIQDRQFIIKPGRITPPGGSFKRTLVVWDIIPLPNANQVNDKSYFHVYQIGKLNKVIFDIDMPNGQWVRANDIAEHDGIIIDVYLENGATVCYTDVWFMFTKDDNFIMALRINNQYDLGSEVVVDTTTGVSTTQPVHLNNYDPVVRFYSNARYDSLEWRETTPDVLHPVRVITRKINSIPDFTQFMADCQAVEDFYGSIGMANYYRDGYIENKPQAFATRYIGKTMTFVWDSSIKGKVFLPVNTLPTFTSLLDPLTTKYLFLSTTDYGTIDYQDDIDFFLVNQSAGTYQGVVINRFLEKSVRMVTHNAYAIMTDIVQAISQAHENLAIIDDLSILAVIRQGGMKHGLTRQHVRIEELYQLDRTSVLQAMAGVNSLVPEWRAENLENSGYCKIMRTDRDKLVDSDIELAYGYNAATTVAEKVYIKTSDNDGEKSFEVTPALRLQDDTGLTRRGVFGYDASGNYLGYINSNSSASTEILPVELSDATAVEAFNTVVSDELDGCYFYNDVTGKSLSYWGFRCYVCGIVDGVPDELWYDVTNTNYYTFDAPSVQNAFTPSVTWNRTMLTNLHLYPCIKIGKYTLMYEYVPAPGDYNGVISFSVKTTQDWVDGLESRIQKISPGTIDVFMDGQSLIENIDYYVEWPVITIVRRPKFTTDMANPHIFVRCRGFANPTTMKHYPPRDIGFVKEGVLSVDGEYDVRDDRNIRIVVDGALKGYEDVSFAERTISLLMTDGRAFGVSDHITPVEPYTSQKTIPFMQRSMEVDKRVSEYLTPRLPEYQATHPAIIIERWALVSPFLSALIHAMVNFDYLNDGRLALSYNNEDVKDWIEPYRHLLDFDPCLKPIDTRYVVIYPHQYSTLMTVDADQYRFLEYVIRDYLHSLVDLTPSVVIG